MAGKNSVFVNNSAPSVDDTYLNLYKTENNNIILGSGQSLSDAIDNQMAIGVSRYAANNFYMDSGVADAYVLTLAASMTNPVSATVGYFIGMTIRFRAGNAGTGGAATVNVNGAGVKSLKEADGSTNPLSILTTEDSEFRYDGTVFRKVNVTPATQTETNAGTNDTKFITPLKLRYGFAASFTAQGYIAFPSWLGGFIIQWGSGTTSAGLATVTYPIPFTSFSASPMAISSPQSSFIGVTISNRTLTYFDIRTFYTNSATLVTADYAYLVVGK